MRLFLIAAMLPVTACHASWEKQGHAAQPSGTGATRSYDATGFTGVDLRGSDDVDVKAGAGFSVRAEGDPRVLDQLEIKVVDGTLRVGRKSGNFSFSEDHGAKIHVVMPKLTLASVAGSGDLTVDRAEGNFIGSVAGSGNLDIAALNADAAKLSVAGSGDMTLAGTVAKLSASIVGSGNIEGKKLTASGASISVVGSGNMDGVVKGGASVSIAGSGDVTLTGGANCAVNAVGSGEAHCS
ncbi:MAG: head GIN domain-containing protein [Sphingomonas sp.]